MQIMKLLLPVVLSAALAPALAASPQAEKDEYAQAAGSHLNGGIGLDGRQAMRAERRHYNLHLSFARGHGGEYLSGVKLRIESLGKAHEEVGTFDDSGPWFYVQLRPGSYRLSAEYEGQTVTRTVTVGAHAVDQVLYWK